VTTGAPELISVLESLVAGRWPGDARIAVFSDLDRQSAAALREAWHAIPVSLRELLVSQSTTLATESLELQFERLAVIALEDEDATVRGLAIESLWDTKNRGVAEKLMTALSADPDQGVRAAAATCLRQFVLLRELDQFDAAIGDAVVQALRAVAGDDAEDVEVRARAIEALGSRTLAWVAELIEEAYEASERRLRLAAVQAMGASADDQWLGRLDDDLQSDDWELRLEAVAAVGLIGSESSVNMVAALLDDEDGEVAMAAVMALGEIGGRRALRHLREFATHAPAELSEVIVDAIELADGSDGPGGREVGRPR
jgi:HEAT repeat protein